MGMGPGVDSSSIYLMLPEEVMEMLSEARLHPALVEQLDSINVKTFEDGIAIIAAYVDVVMHGDYTATFCFQSLVKNYC